MNTTIHLYSDCTDQNAQDRILERYRSLFPNTEIKFRELTKKNSITVLTNAIDLLDAVRFGNGLNIHIYNIASRTETQHENGAPFCFCRLGPSIIIGTPDSFCMLKKLGVVKTVQETDVFAVCKNFMSGKEAERVSKSQYRSFDYVPFLALWLSQGHFIPSTVLKLEKTQITEQIWWCDNFSNCKTTIPGRHFGKKTNGNIVKTAFGSFPFYQQLSQVPVGVTAVTIGSSGYGYYRFAELVINGGRFGQEYNVEIGSSVY